MIDILIECALAIEPMSNFLYKNGVLAIHSWGIHCENELFFKAFKDFKIRANPQWDHLQAVAVYNGVTFYTLVDKEVNDGEDQ